MQRQVGAARLLPFVSVVFTLGHPDQSSVGCVQDILISLSVVFRLGHFNQLSVGFRLGHLNQVLVGFK